MLKYCVGIRIIVCYMSCKVFTFMFSLFLFLSYVWNCFIKKQSLFKKPSHLRNIIFNNILIVFLKTFWRTFLGIFSPYFNCNSLSDHLKLILYSPDTTITSKSIQVFVNQRSIRQYTTYEWLCCVSLTRNHFIVIREVVVNTAICICYLTWYTSLFMCLTRTYS